METSQKLRLAGIALLVVCAILLFTPIGQPDGLANKSCGSVVLPNMEKWFDGSDNAPRGCGNARGNRLMLSLVVGVAGAAVLYGSSQVKKREDE